MIADVDRRSLSLNQRRRAIADALAEEQGRESALVEQLEETVAEVDSKALDEEIFARMNPEDVEIVRAALNAPPEWILGVNDIPAGWGQDDGEPEEDASPDDAERALMDEIVRLQEAIEESRRRRRALERYAAALDA